MEASKLHKLLKEFPFLVRFTIKLTPEQIKSIRITRINPDFLKTRPSIFEYSDQRESRSTKDLIYWSDWACTLYGEVMPSEFSTNKTDRESIDWSLFYEIDDQEIAVEFIHEELNPSFFDEVILTPYSREHRSNHPGQTVEEALGEIAAEHGKEFVKICYFVRIYQKNGEPVEITIYKPAKK